MNQRTERLASRFRTQLTATLSLGNEHLFFACVVLAIAPLWFGQYLPMIDLPQHAGQVAALREIWTGNESFTRLFEVNWFTPYLLGYLLLYALSWVLPMTVATQLLVSLALAAVPLLTGSLLRAAGADERWKWLAIPCAYSFAFYWGFLSFMVAVPVALLFLINTIRFVGAPTVARGVVIAVFALFLFFCHVIVLGVATLTALGYVLGTHYRSGRELAIRLLPLVAPMPLIVAWLLATFDREASVHTDPIVFGPLVYRLEALLIQPSGRDSFSTLVTPLVTGSILVLPWLSGARFSRRPERWLPFAMALAAFLLLPHFVLSTAYVYQRLGVFLVPVWFLAWERTERQWRFDWVPMLVVTVWGLANAGRFAAFARETQTFETVIAAMEPGRTAGAMVVDHSSPFFALPVYMHFPSWYQAQRGGVVDFNFADFHPQMVRYRKEVGSRIGETLAWYPTAFQWSEHDGARYDYFLVKAPWDVSQEIFKDKRGAVRLIAHDGWWWLYSNEERERSR